MKPLTAEEYARLRALADRHEAWVDTRRGKNGWASYQPEEVPEDCRMTNEERSAVEVYEFQHDPPARYFAYVKVNGEVPKSRRDPYRAMVGELTTWTGDKLGNVTFGCRYVLPNGSARVPIWVSAINGRHYHGTYFESSGDYARIRASKS